MKRVVLGISGASGAAIGLKVGELLASLADVETHVVLTDAARRTLAHEIDEEAIDRLIKLSHHWHMNDNIGASIASGSFHTDGMIVAPCSMRSLASIAVGMTDSLLVRAADVHLKERRKLVLLTRETPLHLGHLRNMTAATEMGAIIMPPVPAFYRRPRTLDDVIAHLAARAVDLLGLTEGRLAPEWLGEG